LPAALEISVIVSSYQRPWHLRRCLASIHAQRDIDGQFEVIVVDDGSRDETPAVVAQAAREFDFRLTFITHPHDGYQLSRSRNSGIRAAQAPYLLFTDGDCIFPPDHLRRHLDARRPGVVRSGDCCRLDQQLSESIDEHAVRTGSFLAAVDAEAARFRRRATARARFHQAFRRHDRPKLTGWNIAAWRDQLVRINGFDERFRGWGCEDDDLAARLRASGARIESAIAFTHAYHLWHPVDVTAPQVWSNGANVAYHRRKLRLTRCLAGLAPRTHEQLAIRRVAADLRLPFALQMFPDVRESSAPPDLELLFWPCGKGFSHDADRRVLLCHPDDEVPRSIRRQAHATIEVDQWDDPDAVRRQLHLMLGLAKPVDARPFAYSEAA